MKRKTTEATSFEKCLQIALKRYADAEWLGIHSPLAQPYFMGASNSAMTHAAERGRALQNVIADAWETLYDGKLPSDEKALLQEYHDPQLSQGKGGKYFALALELHYLQRVIRPAKLALIWQDYLNVSKTKYHRDLPEAVRLLGENLLHKVHPRLLLEHPSPPAALYGRQSSVDDLFVILNSGKSINLFGMSGIGKTSVAAAVCQRWVGGSSFWYTLRQHLNDHLDRFLFAMAFFLHQRGAYDLWQQIIADKGRIANPKMAESLAIHALKNLNPRPLLVIDDADLLHPSMFETQNQEHIRLLGFLKRLSESATMLFVGQRTSITDIQQAELTGLDLTALLEWVASLGINGDADDLQNLLTYTSGAPRLLTLCLALIQNGISIEEVASQLKGSPNVGALMSRLLSQIGDVEQRVLAELAVFRQNAPADAWQEQSSALKSLSARGLVQLDLTGGASLLPVWSDLVLGELSPEARAALHDWAAQVRSERGEYTESAYHHWQAGYPETAVDLWYLHRKQAIASGQAGNASVIFNSITAHRLPKPERRALALIRAELARFNGEFKKGLRDLDEVNWTSSHAASDAHKLRGMLFMAMGDNFGALREYQAGLDNLAVLTRKQVDLLTGRSARFTNEGEFSKAWKEMRHIRYLAEAFEGMLHDSQGKYMDAMQSYLRALELAKELGDSAYLATTYMNIGLLFAFREPEKSFPYLNLALETYEKNGDRVEANLVRNNMVVAFMQSGRYQEALPLAQSVVDFTQKVGHSPRAAEAAVNLSEIFFYLGNFDRAVHWAEVSMAQEQTRVIPYALYMIGLVDNARKDFAHAETCFRQIIGDETCEPYIIACAWRGLGEMYKLQSKINEAKEPFHKAIELFEQQNNPLEVEKTRASLSA